MSENGERATRGRRRYKGVELDPDTAYSALCARDRRFDGVFFVGVTTTGIYCRPVCPARTPGRGRCRFFSSAALAERADFRACLRCRPELAPGAAALEPASRLVAGALEHIEAGFLDDGSVPELAATLGVSARHLRRAVQSELGVSPLDLAQTRRLAAARQLLRDTQLPVVEVAFAAGFGSLRRMNALVQRRLGRAPTALRRSRAGAEAEVLRTRLEYRPPLDWRGLLSFLGARATASVEAVEGDSYRRTVSLEGVTGWVEVAALPGESALEVRMPLVLAPKLMMVRRRLRALFDLDARPELIGAHLRRDRRLATQIRRRPGLRVPGAFDGFETAVRAILGQQVSVAAATTLAGRLARRFGDSTLTPFAELSSTFPAAATLASASEADLVALGILAARARAIRELAARVADGRLSLHPGSELRPQERLAALQDIPGIGPWTAQYLGMRVLRWPDAFPAGDLIVRRALGVKTSRAAELSTVGWSPWRAYAVMHLWSTLT